MLTLFAVAAFAISVLFAMGEVAYKRRFPKVTGAFVALFGVLLGEASSCAELNRLRS